LTIRGYASDWRQFTRWCDRAGRNSIPASEDTVKLYVTWMLTEQSRKLTTTERHISAIAHFHQERQLPVPITKEIRNICAGVRRERKEKPQGKAAMTAIDLASISRSCNETNMGLRDRSLLVLGFATALRRSNIAGLRLSDVSFLAGGLIVAVRFSKTDQLGKGKVIEVWPGECPATDPITTLRAWIERRGDWDGPLFARINPRGDIIQRCGLSGDAIGDVVKRALSRTGLDASNYSPHSLRAGFITASHERGSTDQEILNFSGHSSVDMMRRYIRRSIPFAGRNPLEGVL
jgi:integrase